MKVIGVIGRIDPQKNQLNAIRALLELEQARLLLVGHVTDHAYRALLEKTVEEYGLKHRVTLIEGLAGQELVDAYHACDVVLVPSVHEPFGIVVLEAWACGKPVVAASVGALPELIKQGVDGLLPEQLSRGLAVLLENRQLAAQMGAAGRRKVLERYTWEQHARQLTEIYQEVQHEYRLCQ